MSDSRAALRVDALGSLEVHRGPVPVDLGPAKQRAVFAVLALHAGHTVSIESMLDVVWGADQPVSARQLVHTYVARLRRLLEPELPPRARNHIISSATGGYRLTLNQELADVTRFGQLFREARQHLSAGDTVRAFELLGEAMRLWRDPDLTELSTLLQTPDMLDPLRRMWCDAALDYVGTGLDLGEASLVLPVARRLAESEPMNEIAQARYLAALEQTGRRAAAIQHFNNIRVILSAELGVPPGAQLSEAYRKVLAGGAAGVPRRHTTAVADPARPPWRGPGPGLGELIHRDRDLQAVRRLLAEQRLLTITGPPGCGKSALALEAAARLRDDVTGGVVVLECSRIAAPHGLAPSLTAALDGVPDVDTPCRLVRAQHVLVLLDNVEHLIDATVAVVEDVVRNCPNVSVVVTSREPLGLPYEAVWRLHTLSPTENGYASPGRPPAVRLFARRAGQVCPGFRLGADNALEVAALCRQLDDLPLAVEMAAECLAMQTLDELVRRLDNPLHELQPPRRCQPVHHRSLRAAFRRSLECLDAPERWCFARLSTLPRHFRLAAAERAWAGARYGPVDARLMLTSLADKSLLIVRHDAAGPAYGMLGLLHRFAVEVHLAELGRDDVLRASPVTGGG
ncbi:winged helix-turn-helix domain-containing protein [Couchioplanes caeruleus]|uniref:AfsR/SARP family transcriptional regulator n=1 Tax=Couchioplanes caeruleus TaxID=56438 RepID=UPI00201BE332|nr:BTAD domain-containing putative transcriptional regulator [Couchioplanes caeruleus]UQU67732.1 winged helix-turn-helix domain-containing protein [Couchioplanes caeruleus]